MAELTKKFIIQFFAELKNDKVVSDRIKAMGGTTEQTANKIAGAYNKAGNAATKMGQKSKEAMGYMESVGSRFMKAWQIVPAWMGIRAIMQSVIGTIRDGVKHIIDFDQALSKAAVWTQRLPQGTTLEQWRNGPLAGAARGIAMETGKKPEEALMAYRQFAMGGLGAEESLAGMNSAVKLSVMLQGEVEPAARAMVDIYNLLGDSISGASTAQEKMNKISFTMALLDKDNVYELNEMVQAVQAASGAAKIYNLTMEQTLAILAAMATGGQRGSVGGTQLSTMLARIGSQRKIVESFLGADEYKKVTPNGQIKYYETLMAIMEKAAKLNKQEGTSSAAGNDLLEIFGMRGMKGTGGVVGQWDLLAKNNAKVAMSLKDMSREARIMYDTMINTLEVQINRTTQYKNILFEVATIGTDGANNVTTAWTGFNKVLDDATTSMIFLRKMSELDIKIPVPGLTSDKFGPKLEVQKQSLGQIMYDLSGWSAIQAIPEDAAKLSVKLEEMGKKMPQNTHFARATKAMGAFFDSIKKEDDKVKGKLKESPTAAITDKKTLDSIISGEYTKTIDFQSQLNALINDQARSTEGQIANLDRLKLQGIDQIEIEKRKLAEMIKQNQNKEEQYKQAKRISDLTVADQIKKRGEYGSLAEQYHAARGDLEKQSRISDFMQMKSATPEEMAKMWSQGGYNESIITENIGNLSPEQRFKVQEEMAARYNIPLEATGYKGFGGQSQEFLGSSTELARQTAEATNATVREIIKLVTATQKNTAMVEEEVKQLRAQYKLIEETNETLKHRL